MTRSPRWAGPLLALAFFAAYAFTASGSLPPYRDAGEMVSSAHTLGVSHPPGYPLYILLGRLMTALPLGSEAYRMNLLSAAAGALGLWALAWAVEPVAGAFGLFGAVLLGLNRTYWQVSSVPEMYSLGSLLACLCAGLALRLRKTLERPFDSAGGLAQGQALACGLGLAYGLALGSRMDLLLLAPALLLLAFPSWAALAGRRAAPAMALGFFALGLAVYLYLPLRSLRQPWLNWADPSSAGRLFAALSRKAYGGSLDLLSQSYARGENFGADLKDWSGHLGAVFSAALVFAAWGLASWEFWGPGPALAVLLAAPVFLFMANLPPNPHALAILEPHYLTADLFLAMAAAVGAARAARLWPKSAPWSLAACLGLLLWASPPVSRRWNLLARDYSHGMQDSLPQGAVLAAKKDVQLFALWHAREVDGRRRDLALVSQGLSASPWYRAAMSREQPSPRLHPLAQPEAWPAFARDNAPAFASLDAEWPPELAAYGRGLAVALKPAAPPAPGLLEDLAPRVRGDYDSQPDFFSSDLVEAYAGAWHRAGYDAHAAGRDAEAERAFKKAWALKPQSPDDPLFLGLLRFRQGRIPEAARYFEASCRIYDRVLELAAAYKALPAVVEGLRRESATALLNWGAAAEKLGDKALAERLDLKALARDPGRAQAHFNLAVLYWGRDWARVRTELTETLRLDPAHGEAAKFLQRLPK